MKARVSLIRCSGYAPDKVLESVRSIFDQHGGIAQFIKPGDHVLIKPNFLKIGAPKKAITTHPAVLEAIVICARDAGARKISLGDDPPFSTTAFVAKSIGFYETARKYGVDLIDFSKDTLLEGQETGVLEAIKYDRALLEADVLINVPKLKSHCQLILTGAVKNLFGCISGKTKAYLHFKLGDRRADFADMLIENYLKLRPTINIMDGIIAMEGFGPGNGTPRPMNVLAGATDAVALDRVMTEIVGFPLDKIAVLTAARQKGVGITDLNQIEIVGDDIETFKVSDFEYPETMPIRFSLPRIVQSTIKTYYRRWIKERVQSAGV